jgi:hypothetical protein
MKPTFICLHCNQEYTRNPRVKKGQHYCNSRACQNARMRIWKRNKRATSETYREQCKKWQKNWLENNPFDQYIKEYRKRNPVYVNRNRELQRIRDQKYRHTCRIDYIKKLVKSNTFRSYRDSGGIYAFIPGKWQKIVKSNTLMVTIQLQK